MCHFKICGEKDFAIFSHSKSVSFLVFHRAPYWVYPDIPAKVRKLQGSEIFPQVHMHTDP